MGHVDISIEYKDHSIWSRDLLPIVKSNGSPLCAVFWLTQHILDFPNVAKDSNMFVCSVDGQIRPLSYQKLMMFFKCLLKKSGKDTNRVGIHSLRRAGAAYMHSVGHTLEDIRQAGDWSSLAALIYLAKPISHRIESDSRVAELLRSLSCPSH